MTKTFVTSDTHFGHVNIIRYCNRPFGSVTQMNDAMIERWNARVGLDDVIYFLGDFAMGPKVDPAFTASMLLQLNGFKHIMLGNHDQPSKWGPGLRAVVQEYRIEDCEVHDAQIVNTRIDGKEFVMCHFPISAWENEHHGSIHLHGHVHTQYSQDVFERQTRNCYDIGVDMYGGPVQITGDLRFLNDPKGWA